MSRRQPTGRCAGAFAVAGALLALCGAGPTGCGDATPEGGDLASPAETEAVPRGEEEFEETAEQRQRERIREDMPEAGP